MAIAQWGVIARSRSTQLQIRQKLATPFTNPADAQAAALEFQTELNSAAKFGLTDWIGMEDAVAGGPHEAPVAVDPTVTGGTSTHSHTGMNGLIS
jgi:hypothetical protein